jgi:heme exporter protein D
MTPWKWAAIGVSVVCVLLFVFAQVSASNRLNNMNQEADSLKREVRAWKKDFKEMSTYADSLELAHDSTAMVYDITKQRNNARYHNIPRQAQELMHSPVPDQLTWWRAQADSSRSHRQ